MLEEEVISKDLKHTNERLLVANVLAALISVPILFLLDADISRAFFVAIGIFAPINVISYKISWINAHRFVLLGYFALLLPYFALIAINIKALGNPIVEIIDIDNVKYLQMLHSPSAIVSANLDLVSSLMKNLVYLSVAATALSMLFLTESKFTIRRIFTYCSIFAVVLGAFSIIFHYYVEFSKLDNTDRLFAFFKDKALYSSFALLWICVLCALTFNAKQRFTLLVGRISRRDYSYFFTMFLVLSVLIVGSELHRLLSISLFALLNFALTIDCLPTKANLKRLLAGGKSKRSVEISSKAYVPFMVYVLMFILSTVGALIVSEKMSQAGAENTPEQIVEAKKTMMMEEAATKLIEERPIFGWGSGSVGNLITFVQDSRLGERAFSTTNSNLMDSLIEGGVVALILKFIMPAILLIWWVYKHTFSISGMFMMVGCAMTLALGIVEVPFDSLSVLISFYIIFVGAIKWDTAEVR